MPTSKSTEKRLRQSEKRRLRNSAVKSRMKTEVKKAIAELARGSDDSKDKALRLAYKAIDKAASKGVIHGNAAARRKSRLAKRMKKVETVE